MTLADWCRYVRLVTHPATIVHLADDLADTQAQLDRARRTLHLANTPADVLAEEAAAYLEGDT